jgi:hypothetical protein
MLFPNNHIMVMLATSLGAVAMACAVLVAFFVLLFLHHKGALEPFLPHGAIAAQTTGHRSVTDDKMQDYWIVGSWLAFAALCVVLRMSRPRHGSH